MEPKKIISTALVMITAMTSVASVANASVNSNSRSSESNLTERVITKAIVYDKSPDGQLIPKCAVSTAGRPDLIPNFATAAPAGFKSQIRIRTENGALPRCDAETQSLLALSIDYQVMEGTKLAILGVAVPLVLACVAGGAVGYATSSYELAGTTGAVIGGVAGGYTIHHSSVLTWIHLELANGVIGAAAGAGLALACQIAGQKVAHYIYETKR